MKKIRVLLASILIQSCLGGIYAWSAFSPALCKQRGLSSAQAALLFGATIMVFTSAMVWAGRAIEKQGPRRICAIGAGLYALGYLLSSFSSGSFMALLTGISLVSGVGIGLCYVCPLATCIRWFPEQKGLVTGLTVAGFGAGAILLSNATGGALSRGSDVLGIFRWIGLGYGALILLAALQLEFPEERNTQQVELHPAYRAVLSKKGFWGLVVGMFAGTFGGLLIIGNLKSIGIHAGISVQDSALAVSLFAVGNASGRVIWGLIHDWLGRRVIPVSLVLLSFCMMPMGMHLSREVFLTIVLIIGFSFGACFVLYAAELAAMHGPGSIGRFYPIIFLAYGVAGVGGPLLGGWLYDRYQSFMPAIIIGSGVVMLGSLVFGVLRERREVLGSTPLQTAEEEWPARVKIG